ncbi:hypothetical protein G4228_001739 [Cervus hanglu yarkandensis]|nr:hypothetical protein G4228_001739 [Cervus hanglu yarkandensis]
MWLHLAVLVGLYYLLRWYRETQVVSHLRDKFVFITGCDSGFGNLLARQLDLRGLRVLAACLTEQGAEQLRNETSDRLQTVILDVTKTESIAAATEWVKERVGDREAMWLHLAVLVGLYYLLRWYRETQVVSHLRDKFVFITGCDSGFGNLLARQLDLRGLRVLAACLTEQGTEQLRNQTSDRLQTVILDVTKTESVAVATEWVKERVGDRVLKILNLLKPPWPQNLSLVTDCMEHALTACHPRTRYSPGWDAKFLYLPMSYLPSFLVDLMVYWCYPRPAKAL